MLVLTLQLLVKLGIYHAQHFMMRSLEVVTSQTGTDVQTTPTEEIIFTGAAQINRRSYPDFLQVVSTWTNEEFQHFNQSLDSAHSVSLDAMIRFVETPQQRWFPVELLKRFKVPYTRQSSDNDVPSSVHIDESGAQIDFKSDEAVGSFGHEDASESFARKHIVRDVYKQIIFAYHTWNALLYTILYRIAVL